MKKETFYSFQYTFNFAKQAVYLTPLPWQRTTWNCLENIRRSAQCGLWVVKWSASLHRLNAHRFWTHGDKASGHRSVGFLFYTVLNIIYINVNRLDSLHSDAYGSHRSQSLERGLCNVNYDVKNKAT